MESPVGRQLQEQLPLVDAVEELGLVRPLLPLDQLIIHQQDRPR